MRQKFIHFYYPVNCSNILLKEYYWYCIYVCSYFMERYTVENRFILHSGVACDKKWENKKLENLRV